MVAPSRPWPKPTPYDDVLSELVASGDINRVRGYFDEVFWEGRKERPGWEHLQIALMREDRPMLRLLHTWGAAPSDEDMKQFRALAQEKYPDYVRVLRAAGLRPSGTNWEELPAAAKTAPGPAEEMFSEIEAKKASPQLLEQVPQEWRAVLGQFQALGADEAIIAGGALRDTFNGRAVRDVDIFLRARGGKRKHKNFIREAFAVANIEIREQQVGYDYGPLMGQFPEPSVERRVDESGEVRREREMEAWKIIAGPNKTEYNIIFVEDALDRRLAKEASKFEQRSLFAGGLLEAFDIALCQVACDGREVVSTPAYRNDVKYKRVTLLKPNDTSNEHLKRVTKKYEGWELSPSTKKALAAPPPPSRSSGYSWY